MQAVTEKKGAVTLKSIIAAAQKLSAEEKQVLKMKLFGDDAFLELKAFEKTMRKKRKPVKKSDDEIVSIIKKNRAER